MTLTRTYLALLIGFGLSVAATDLVRAEGVERDESLNQAKEFDEPSFYFGPRGRISDLGNLGPSGSSLDYDPGIATALTAGARFGPTLGPVGGRLEVEAGYFTMKVDKATINGLVRDATDSLGELRGGAAYASAFADLHVSHLTAHSGGVLDRFVPFVGVGLGGAYLDFQDHGSFSDGLVLAGSDIVPALHLSAGFGVEITDRTTVEFGARIERFLDVSVDGSHVGDVERKSLTLGLRRSF